MLSFGTFASINHWASSKSVLFLDGNHISSSDCSCRITSLSDHPAVECLVSIGSSTSGVLSLVSKRFRLSTSESTLFSSRSSSFSPVYGSIPLNPFFSKLEVRSKLAAGWGICSECSSSQIGYSNVPRLWTKPECLVSIWFLYHVLEFYFLLQYGHRDPCAIQLGIELVDQQYKWEAKKLNLLCETD